MIQIRPRGIAVPLMLAASMLFSGAQLAWSKTSKQNGDSPQGVTNWGRVTDTLYRGAQPNLVGFKALQMMGVSIVVNFRDEPGETASEKNQVESLGLKYVGIPWSGDNNPSSAQVAQFLDLVRANPQAKIFVHCKRGADRTGVMVAAYRIAVEHKSVADAVSEMHQFHYDHFFLPQLERYVRSLPGLLLSNSVFSAYAPVASTPSAPSAAAAASLATIVPAPVPAH